LTGSVLSWIQWSLDNLPREGDIPPINWRGAGRPWETCGIELFQSADKGSLGHDCALVTIFERLLSLDPLDLPTRFTALSVYYELSGFSSIYEEQFVTEHRSRHLKNFKYLVHLVAADDCSDARNIRWEILNSYAIHDWDRAHGLYGRLEALHLVEPSDLDLLCAQFRFLLVFGSEIELELSSLEWAPKVYGLEDSECKLLLFLAGLCFRNPDPNLTQEHRECLLEAKNELEKALIKRGQLPPAYRSILARAFFSTGHYDDASTHYAKLLDFSAHESLFPLREGIYASLALSYRRANRIEKAIETLERWAAEFPDDRGIYLQIAELRVIQADLPGVSDALRNEIERNPEFESTWWVSPLVVTGETWVHTGAEKEKLRARPQYEQIQGLLKDYWPPFARMTEGARDEWICGVIDWLSWHPKPDLTPLRTRILAKAANAHAIAVELELASRVFSEYRKFALSNPTIKCLASYLPAGREGDELKVLAAISLPLTEFEKHAPTLGQMAYIIGKSNAPKHPLWEEFQK